MVETPFCVEILLYGPYGSLCTNRMCLGVLFAQSVRGFRRDISRFHDVLLARVVWRPGFWEHAGARGIQSYVASRLVTEPVFSSSKKTQHFSFMCIVK